MSMNLSWLDDFLALAASGNFSRAAEERHMTQPAFSRRIRALEEWLGADLFDRSTQPARLTATGEWFRHVAHEQLARVARLPGEAKAVAEAHSTTLRFAATHALSFNFMPGWLRSLESHTSVGPIHLVSDVFARCEAMLLQSQVQFVLSHAQSQASSELQAQDCPFVQVGSDTLVAVSSPDAQGRPRHELMAGAPGSPVPWLSYSPESGMGQILRHVKGAALERCHLHSVFQAHLASVLRTMTLDGRGLAWLPLTLIDEDLRAGRLVKAAAEDWQVHMDIRLYRDRLPLSQAAEAFWAAVSRLGA
jgi:LysR family transcriptional regulator, hypochlorite-specific transcription factor HypT